MRYVSALKNSKFYNQFMKILILLMLVPPVMVFFIIWRLMKNNGMESGGMLPEFLFIIGVMILSSVIAIVVVRYVMERQNSVIVEINDEGVNHIAPGKPRMYLWNEVREAKIIRMGNKQSMVRISSDKENYIFYQYLVPDEPGAPQISFGIGGMKWKYMDGSTVPVKIENTVGYEAVHKYIPDKIR